MSCLIEFDRRKAAKRRKHLNPEGNSVRSSVSNRAFLSTALFFLSLSVVFGRTEADAQLITGRPPIFVNFEPFVTLVPEGGSLDLRCPLVSDAFDVEWFKDGHSLGETGDKLTVPRASRMDSGDYQCYASNGIGGAFSPSANVTVLYLDGFDKESQDFYARTVASSEYFVLRPPGLIASPAVKVSWRWLFEGHEVFINDTHYISTEGELVVLKAAGHYGAYQVEADSEKGAASSDEYWVRGQASKFSPVPDFTIVLRPKDATVNAAVLPSATFECVPSLYGRYPADIKWLLNGESLLIDGREVRTEHANRRLVIGNAVRLIGRGVRSAKIRCEAKSPEGQIVQFADALLEVVEQPVIDRNFLPSERVYAVGDSVKLECRTSKAWPRARIAWFFNKQKLAAATSEVLKIDHLSENQFGVYQCRASNSAGSDSAQVWIKADANAVSAVRERSNDGVGEQLVIVEQPEDVTVPAGRDVTLQCRTEDPHNTQLSWTFNGTAIPRSNPRYTFNSTTLTVHSSKKADGGVYTCLATASSGLVGEASAQVTVSGAKFIEYGPSNQSILIGSNVQIPCKLADDFAGQEEFWTSWTRNDVEIPSTGDTMRRISINDGNLRISQVGPDNIGLYTCTVRSSKGSEESASGWLKIIEKPSMPQNVHASLVNDTVPAKIKVDWRPGFDGNSPIIKHAIDMCTMGPTGLWSNWENVVENVPSELCCSSLVDNIRPSSTARFRVIAFNRYGAGKPSQPSENITMPQQPPAAAPRNVAASARSSSSVMVQWQEPLPDQWNGDILGYHIRYRLSGYATADWNEKNVSKGSLRNALIEPLITWREYEIQVAAYNERGLGVYSKPVEVTTLEGVPMQAPQNVDVVVLNSTHIRVSFDPPNQQMIPGVNLGYKIELWKGIPHQGQPFRTVRVFPELSRIEEVVGDLEKFGHYNLTTVCFTSPGDGPPSDPIEVVTKQDIPGPVASVDFDQVMSNSVLVLWEKPTEPNGIITKYVVRHWEDRRSEEKHTFEINAEETGTTIEGLTPSTKYSIDVQAVTAIGAGPRIEAKFESGVPPELPGKPTSLDISDVGARSVVLQFVPGFDGHSFIRKWHVEACIGSSSIFTQIFNISAPKVRSFTVEGLRPFTKYKLRLIAENVRGRGAPSDASRVFQTRQTNPENAPEKLFAEPVSDNEISLVWTPLISSHWNGEPSGYLVRYRSVSEKVADEGSSEKPSEWKEIRASNPKASDLTLTGLRPFTSYQIKIYAENTFGQSEASETVFATTYESVPSGAPQNVVAELDRSKRAIVVTWEDVEEKHCNGIISGYIVRVVPDEVRLRSTLSTQVEVIGADQHMATVKNLRPFTEYRVFVMAFTIVGEGPQNSNPPLIVTAEQAPDEPTGLAFSYVSSNEVRLKWMPPLRPNGKILAYEVRHWKLGQEGNATAVKLPYSMFGFSATQLTPNTTYVFGVKAETSVGWGPEEVASVFTSERKVPPPVPPTPKQHSGKPPTATDIWIQWPMYTSVSEELTADDAPVRWVSLQYQRANDDDWVNFPNWISARKNEVQVSSLTPNTAYRFRIRFTGDFAESVWSVESDWIKTRESAPSKPPTQLQATPYESSSIMLHFSPPERDQWNSDHIGYRILYRVYPSNDSFKAEEIPPSDEVSENGRIQHVVQKLVSFRHYVVQVQSFNAFGNSIPSRPEFVYVGYSIPKQTIRNLMSEPLSSTSLRVRWDEWVKTDDDVISGYRIRYAPLLSVLSPEIENEARGGDSTEEVVISEHNELVLTDLRKYTEYQVSVAGYNRAGEGQSSAVRVRTLEDLPGPVGSLEFHDIMLDSVNVSWKAPQQPNGKVINYVVHLRTYKPAAGYENSVNQKTDVNYYTATNLEENATYFFSVQAVNAAGKGTENTGNVTVGFNVGSPEAPSKPTFTPEPSSFVLYWKDGVPGTSEITGHLIQAKRVGTARPVSSSSNSFEADVRRRAKREDIAEFRPRHVIGEWVTISNVLGSDSEYRISYRQLEPASVYVFRVFARNYLGIGKASAESDQLVVPESIPEDPFYTKWWFIAGVGVAILLVVLVFVALLCLTNNGYKQEKREAFDTLQLADGPIASRPFKHKNDRRLNDLPSRPDTTTSWISNEQLGAYGAIGAPDVSSRTNSVYRALETDNLPPPPSQPNRNSNYASYATANGKPRLGSNSAYSSRFNLENRGSTHRLSEYNTSHLMNDRTYAYQDDDDSPYAQGFGAPDPGSDAPMEANTSGDFARHYQVANANEDIYRATWRKTREQAEQEQVLQSPLPLPPVIPSSQAARSSEASNDTSLQESEGTSQSAGMAPGISLRALFPQSNFADRNSIGSHTLSNAPNGFSSFV